MTITLGRRHHRIEIEVIGGDLFIRLPFIGALASNSVTPWCFTPWRDLPRPRSA